MPDGERVRGKEPPAYVEEEPQKYVERRLRTTCKEVFKGMPKEAKGHVNGFVKVNFKWRFGKQLTNETQTRSLITRTN